MKRTRQETKKGRGYRSPSVRREHGSRGTQLIKRKKLS